MRKYTTFIIFVVLVIIAGTALFGETFASYKSSGSGEAGVGVALFLVDDSLSSITVPLENMSPGDTFRYNFYVTNENASSQRAEVSLDYTISIQRTTNIPFTIKLISDSISSSNLLLPSNINDVYNSGVFTMNHNNREIHNYTLIVEWDDIYNDYNYANRLDGITMTLRVVQKAGE